ncbi:MAG: HD domain-containing protein [Clostridiales bacterium]|nr:HD domain-containing protein [Clostridiales bacterium]
MKTINKIGIILIALVMLASSVSIVYAKSYMSDKTEIPVDLEVSGAEALCQTDDGYVWIAQYSGLTRYDSKEFVTFKSVEYNGQNYDLINVRALATKDNVLYVATSNNVFRYRDNKFEVLEVDTGVIRDIILDEKNGALFISTESNGAIIYEVDYDIHSNIRGTEGKNIADIALDTKRDMYYYQMTDGVYNSEGSPVYLNPKILDIYSYDDILYIGQDDGIIHRYNMETKEFLDDIVVSDQINKMLYYEEENVLFVACEKIGLVCVDLNTETPTISVAGDLENKSQLIDLMIDYEGNLWVASHYIGASGVSIITKNQLLELLYDDPIWQKLNAPPEFDRNVYAVEKFEDTLYIISSTNIYFYDLNSKAISENNIVMDKINEYADAKTEEGRAKGDENYIFNFSPKDVEVHDGKVFFAVSSIGVVEYDTKSQTVVIYDVDYISSHLGKVVGNPEIALTNSVRSMRSFDGYLALGYSRGIMKFDGETFSVMNIGSNVLYINKTRDGQLMFDRTKGLYVIDDDFTTVTEIPTENNITGNRLKFLVDGDYIYYNLNSRLFRLKETNGTYVSEEITIPYVKGSIVELAKIEYQDKSGATLTKYVIGSQTQVYICDSLEGDKLEQYEFYDATNGLQPIIANTSGYYDEAEHKYYFQSTNGIYVYSFNEERDVSTPVKVVLSSIDLDGVEYYGNTINVDKDVYRVAFNLSVLGFSPNKGYRLFTKLDGVDASFNESSDDNRVIYYTNLAGGEYVFHVYVIDEYGQKSNQIDITLIKEKQFYEQIWFWVIVAVVAIVLIVLLNILIIRVRTKKSLKRQLEYKNITIESIQAIARTIDAKDEYTNGHSIRVGYYSKIIAENLGMTQDEVDNIYYIALLHDIGKIAIPDNILNKPGRLTDEEFAVMKSHTTRGANILKGISTIPQIIEGAKSHHEKYDGSGYPEGLKGEDIPYVARIICCADCFDAMASKRVYKEPFPLEKIISEFERCAGTQFDPHMAQVVVEMIKSGKLKPYTAENTYLGSDGKTHRVSKSELNN